MLIMNCHNKKNLTIYGRRSFLKTSLVGDISALCLPLNLNAIFSDGKKVKFRLLLDTLTRYFDEKRRNWIHPRSGVISVAGKDELPHVIMTMNLISRSCLFNIICGLKAEDLSKTWTIPEEIILLAPHYEEIEGVERPAVVGGFWLCMHKKSKIQLETGHTVVYASDWKFACPLPRHTSYAIYNPDTNKLLPWEKLGMPDPERFYDCSTSSTQRYYEEDRSILLPVYFRLPMRTKFLQLLFPALNLMVISCNG